MACCVLQLGGGGLSLSAYRLYIGVGKEDVCCTVSVGKLHAAKILLSLTSLVGCI